MPHSRCLPLPQQIIQVNGLVRPVEPANADMNNAIGDSSTIVGRLGDGDLGKSGGAEACHA